MQENEIKEHDLKNEIKEHDFPVRLERNCNQMRKSLESKRNFETEKPSRAVIVGFILFITSVWFFFIILLFSLLISTVQNRTDHGYL